MDRVNTMLEILRRANKGDKAITEIIAGYEGYSRGMLYRDIKKYGIVKENDLYIIPGDQEPKNLEGQIDLLDQEPKESDKVKRTFEIDNRLAHFIKVVSAIENISQNDWVNNTLWKAIPGHLKSIIDNE